tara:strand:+ start:435 stop:953 length:519 start_codon:yes stop_codon:yes gene_type:complete
MRKLIANIAKKANKKLVDKIARSRELKAGVSPSNPRARAARNRIRKGAQKTAKNIYKGTAAGTGVATGSTATGVAASRVESKSKAQAPKPKPKPAPKSKATGKAFDVAGLRSAYNKAITPKPKKPLGPENKPAKKVAKKTTKSKFDRMTPFQINRLRGKEAAAYRKYKKGKK